MRALFTALVLTAFLPICAPAAEFELKDGDKVVWLGSTLIEREQRYGYWEAALTARWPERKITFRNLGWSGDNVFGEARLAFDINNPALGLKRMVELALAEKPTVIIICYGTNESFEGEAGLEKFEKGYEKLLDALAPAKARIVLMTPPPFEARSLQNAKELNEHLNKCCDATKRIGKKHGFRLADLYEIISSVANDKVDPPWTDNGMHFSEYGYYRSVIALGYALGLDNLNVTEKFVRGVENAPPLRHAIIEKNKLYFYRWRPQNETYLFGFRKHEQGKNGKEIAEFDPLVAKAEEEIDRLKKENSRQNDKTPPKKK